MRTITVSTGLKTLLSLVLALTTGVPVAFADGGGNCYDSLVKKCTDAGTAAGATLQSGMAGAAAGAQAGQLQGAKGAAGAANSQAATNLNQAAQTCRDMKAKANNTVDDCEDACPSSQADVKTCNDKLESAAQSYATQAGTLNNTAAGYNNNAGASAGNGGGTGNGSGSGSGSGGGASSMMAPLMMAAMGAALGYMLSKNQKQTPQQPQVNPNAAYNPYTGTLDCSKPDAFQYSPCDQYLASLCSSEVPSQAYATDVRCQSFGARFCGTGQPITAPTYDVPLAGLPLSGPVPQTGQVGEGIGQPFCQQVNAINFCVYPGRTQCPSCRQLANVTATGCIENPAQCLVQNSNATIAAAAQTCPTDPIFSNPSVAASVVPGVVSTALPQVLPLPSTVVTGALPPVVLPQAASGSASTGNNAAARGTAVVALSAAPGGSSGGASGSAAGAAVREGYGSGTAAVAMSATAARGSVGSVAAGRDVASTGAAYQPASVTAGPASDVQGQYGPSLFATSTQAIRQRCAAGKLYNCP